MASQKVDISQILEQAFAEKAKNKATKKEGKRKKAASTSGDALTDLTDPPLVETSVAAAPGQGPLDKNTEEPAPKRQRLVTKGGRVKEVAPCRVRVPEEPVRTSEPEAAGGSGSQPSNRSEHDDLPDDDLPIGVAIRGSRHSSSLPPRPNPASFQPGQSSRTVELRVGLKESFKYGAIARQYSMGMFTDADLARLANMKKGWLDFVEALEKHTLEGMMLLRGLREEKEDLLEVQRRLRKKYNDEVVARKNAEKKESAAFYAQQKLDEAMENLKKLMAQKEEQFAQAQQRATELSNAAAVATNKYQTAARELKEERAAHREELKRLTEALEASQRENARLGRAFENLETEKLEEKKAAVEEAVKTAVEEFRASEEYRADLVSQALPSYELGMKKFCAVVMEKDPEFDLKEVEAHLGLFEDEDDEDDEDDDGREEDKVPPEAPTTEVQVAQVADAGASSRNVLEKVGSNDLPDLELPPPPTEGLPKETPPPPAETS